MKNRHERERDCDERPARGEEAWCAYFVSTLLVPLIADVTMILSDGELRVGSP